MGARERESGDKKGRVEEEGGKRERAEGGGSWMSVWMGECVGE